MQRNIKTGEVITAEYLNDLNGRVAALEAKFENSFAHPAPKRTIYFALGRYGDRPSVAAVFGGGSLHLIAKWDECDIQSLSRQIVDWLKQKSFGPVQAVVDRSALGESFGDILGFEVSRSGLADTVVCFEDQVRVHSLDTRTRAVFRVLDLMTDPNR